MGEHPHRSRGRGDGLGVAGRKTRKGITFEMEIKKIKSLNTGAGEGFAMGKDKVTGRIVSSTSVN